MKVILASQSPRRKDLLSKIGLKFECISSDFEEFFDEDRDTADLAEELALGKAEDVAKTNADAVVIGGDTLVSFEGRQLGKPKSEDEARKTLRAYSNKACKVVSSAAVIHRDSDFEAVMSDAATIKFGPISEQQIDTYLKTGDYKDKGGSFALQHPLARTLIEEIKGSEETIIGLPMNKLTPVLENLGVLGKAEKQTNKRLDDQIPPL